MALSKVNIPGAIIPSNEVFLFVPRFPFWCDHIAKRKDEAFCKNIKLKNAQVFSNPPGLTNPT